MINKHDLCRQFELNQSNAEEIFSYGHCSSEGKLTFLQFVLAMRGFVENEIQDWLKATVGDE